MDLAHFIDQNERVEIGDKYAVRDQARTQELI